MRWYPDKMHNGRNIVTLPIGHTCYQISWNEMLIYYVHNDGSSFKSLSAAKRHVYALIKNSLNRTCPYCGECRLLFCKDPCASILTLENKMSVRYLLYCEECEETIVMASVPRTAKPTFVEIGLLELLGRIR